MRRDAAHKHLLSPSLRSPTDYLNGQDSQLHSPHIILLLEAADCAEMMSISFLLKDPTYLPPAMSKLSHLRSKEETYLPKCHHR